MRRHSETVSVFLCLACGLFFCQGGARADHAAQFSEEVAPILSVHCLECHGSERKGGLDLRSRETFLEGGKGGPVVVPGKPEESGLFRRVSTHEMPPKEPLSAAEIEILGRWIGDGAYFPDAPLDPFAATTEKRAGYDWWSLQPLRDAAPPEDIDAALWRGNPVDRFIYAALKAPGLAPSPPADSRTLLRRATYDLTGLPPTPDELRAFAAACAAETGDENSVGESAYRALIERLLASPHYGERWGQHWLDVVRYGESTGFEVNHLIDNIWPYRDYIIRSFNEDKPFNKLALEQLAGDTADPGNPEVEVALTFLVCGPYDIVGNQDPVQAAQIRANTIDEMIRTASEAFLGLTVGCARCHDHKFDPISQRDYYGLYATFAGVRHDDRTVATPEALAADAARRGPLEDARSRLAREVADIENAIIARAENKTGEYDAKWTRDPVNRRGTEETFSPVKARHLRLVVEGRDDDPEARTGYRIDEFEVFTAGETPRNIALAAHGGRAEGENNVPGDFAQAYDAGLTIDGRYGARWIAGGPELVVHFGDEYTIDRVIFSSDRQGQLEEKSGEIVFPGEYRIEVSLDGENWSEAANSHDRKPANDRHRRKRMLDRETNAEERARLDALGAESGRVNGELAAIPPLPRLRVGNMEDLKGPFHVFAGGDPQRPTEEVSAASGKYLAGAFPGYTLNPGATNQERRQALARWIVHKDNPLTPRVLANRLWQHHFGAGIVSTPSDFGFMGTPPSHPELLDWLARELVSPSFDPDTLEDDAYGILEKMGAAWRLKRMHRIIMLSRAYRQASTYRAEAAARDYDSRLLWRFPPQRLDAESLRDTMLALAGVLDPRMGGPGFQLYTYMRDNVATYKPMDDYAAETYRRSIYHQKARAMHIDLLTDFDSPDCAMPAPRRVATTSPLQALTLLNHDFTLDMAEALAARLDAEEKEPARQVERAFQLALLRTPEPEEKRLAVDLISRHGLQSFCRALFNLNEMIYLD